MGKATLSTSLALLALGCGGGDYMSADLRSRVEQLKKEMAVSATSEETVSERAQILWDWGNAYALSGGVLPVNLTTAKTSVARASRAEQTNGGTGPTAYGGSLLRSVDNYLYELQIKDERPDAIGELEIAPSGPLAAGSFVTLEQTYVVGSMPMADGGVVMLGRQLMSDQGLYQNTDSAADHYVSIRSSGADATWERIESPLAGMHGGFRGAEPMPAFRLRGASLGPGDSFTVIYGDRSGGSRGFGLQTFSSDQLLLPLYLDLEANGVFLTPRWPAVTVEGNEVRAVSAIAPSVVAVGESFVLRIRSEDGLYNRATGSLPGYRVLLAGEEVAVVAAGGDALTNLENLSLEQPGVYRYEVVSEDDSLSTLSNPVWVQENPSSRVYWGETHGHTGMAEGQGSAGQFYVFARYDARLDFAGISEHDSWLDDYEWQEMQRLARETTEEGEFVAFLGYEWSSPRQLGGHHNVFFRTPDKDRVGGQVAPMLQELYRGLHQRVRPEEVLIIPHAHQAGDWTQSDPELERLVEIYSMHGSFEWFGNLYLQNGFEIGFIAASDDHRSRPGYAHGLRRAPLAQWGGLAAVLAPEKTTDAIFDGLRDLSAYATSGPRIVLDVRVNGEAMGTRQSFSETREIEVRAMGTSPIDHIDIVKNGEVILSRHYLDATLQSHTWLQIGFESSSEVFEGRDNPRPYRVWEGFLDVKGARVLQVLPVGLDNAYLESASLDSENEGRVLFHAETRGRRDTLLIELEGATATTTVDLHLEPTQEYGFAPVMVRQPAELPAEELRMSLADLEDGRFEHKMQVDLHTDRVRIQLVDPEASMDRELQFTDMEDPESGDYYYVRLTQLDGGQAWSSPFWIGD